MQMLEASPSLPSATDVVAFWRNAGPGQWFAKNDAFDDEFRARFLALHEEAAAQRLDSWNARAESALGLVLLLDQFPRNCFRDTPRMYATDPLARAYADAAIRSGFDEQIDPKLRLFFYLPFEHSEDLRDQQRSMVLHERLGFTRYAEHHLHIIQRFGRFPHRNAILGRASTPEEQAFLSSGGFAG